MKFGLADHHWNIIETLLIRPLKVKGYKLWVFGSRARGDQKKFSDLDILVSEECIMPLKESELFHLKEALVESDLPIKVDVVLEKEVASSYFQQIQKEKILVS